jgi:tetratricopeptide (TPR) repeat protein
VPSSVFNPAQGKEFAERALRLAQELDDGPAMAKILWSLLLVHFFLHRPKEAAVFGEQALEIARQENLREQLAYILNDLGGFAYLGLGDYRRGLAVLEEAIALWKELDNRYMLSDSLTEWAYLSMSAGKLQAGLERSAEAVELNQSTGNAWGMAYCLGVAGFIRYLLGDVDQAVSAMIDSLSYHDQGGFAGARSINHSLMAVIYTRAGDHQRGLEHAGKAVAGAESGISFWIPGALASLVLTHLQAGNLQAADEAVEKIGKTDQGEYRYFYVTIVALAECEYWLTKEAYDELLRLTDIFLERMLAGQTYVFGPYAQYYRGLALLGKGDEAGGYSALVEGRDLARTILLRDAWWRSAAKLAAIEWARGNQAAARRLFEEAAEAIQYIADHSIQTGLRASFLQTEAVRQVQRKIEELQA